MYLTTDRGLTWNILYETVSLKRAVLRASTLLTKQAISTGPMKTQTKPDENENQHLNIQ